MNPMILLSIALGGALGALLRYFMASLVQSPNVTFPWGIFVVNVTGGLAMGVLVELAALKVQMTPEVRTFLLVGVLGGYTTFSSFSLDSVMLIERGAYMNAALYIIGSVAISIGALFAGMWIIRTV
jgi:CrcB protein